MRTVRFGPDRVRDDLRTRGAIMVESAIVTASILTLVLGTLEFGLLGFLQITVDAGAILNAHQNAIGVNDALGPADATHLVFPQIQTASIGNSVLTAPSPTVPVDYQYNGTTAEQAASANNRHGGASMMQPYLSQTTITQSPFTFLGQRFRVHSQASEAKWLETTPEWDVGNANYGGAYTAGNNAYNADYFTQGENTPPYYVSFNFIKHCATPGSWGLPTGQAGVCPSSDFLSLGMAEYLDIYNWSNGTAGVTGYANSTGPGGSTGTFEAMACHQRELSTLVFFFQYLAGNYGGNSSGFASDPLNYLETTYNPYYYNQGGYTNFTNANFFHYNYPSGSTTSSISLQADNAIGVIYGWDVERGTSGGLGSNPGDNPLHPTVGCV